MTEKMRNGPRRVDEVRRRARDLMEKEDLPYHRAMRKAGWLVRRATGSP